MTQPAKNPYVFISHASGDVKVAREIVAKLHQHGVVTWMAPDDVQPGREFSIQLEEAIEGCKAFVVLMSDKANASAFVRAETELAFGKRDIFPVRIADVQPAGGLALFLRLKHWTDAFGPDREANLTRLAETINRMSAAGEDMPPPPPSPKPQPLLIVPDPDPTRPLADEEATRAYIGEKAPHFLEKWRRMDARKSIVSFSFPGFIFGPFWLFYRKIFKEGLIVAGVAFVMSTFAVFGQVMHEEVIQVLVNLVSFGVALGIGLFGNHLYRRHVAGQTALLDAAGQDPQAVRDQLAMQGGTSPAAPLGLLAGLFVANLIMFGIASTCCSAPAPVPYVYPTTPATETLAGTESSPAVVATETPTSESSATIYTVCFVNDTPFEITFTINPDKSDSSQETLGANGRKTFATYSAIDPQVRFDADATDAGTNLSYATAVTVVLGNSGPCTNTYHFTNAGDTVSLSKPS
jgi:hypothetical protein